MKKLENIVGITKNNNKGSKMTIIEYFNSFNITVLFDNGCVVKNVSYGNFKRGSTLSKKCRTVYKVGYLDGEYKNLTNDKSYIAWKSMMFRCYSGKEKHCYDSCVVCEEWHSFANFKQWYLKNYYIIDNEIMCLDKDVLSGENKIYSPDTCIYLPIALNSLLVKDHELGECKKGVYIAKRIGRKKYVSEFCGNYIGAFDSEDLAHEQYLKLKKEYIKNKIISYKFKLPKHIFKLLEEKYIIVGDINV